MNAQLDEFYDATLRRLVARVDESDIKISAVDLLALYITGSSRLTQFERDTVNSIVNPTNDISDDAAMFIARRLFARAQEIGDSLED